jgi:replicative DNA helicase
MNSYELKSTGFQNLDFCLNGGLHAGLYVVGGVSSLGKTTFTHQIADNVASQGSDVLFFSLEQSKMELVSKSLSRETCKLNSKNALTARNIMTGEKNINAVRNYLETAKNLKVIEGNFNTTVRTIREYINNHVNINNDNPLVIVDYLQIIQSIDYRMSDKQKIDTNVTELKRISRDFNIPLIVISSLNRDSYLCPISYESFKESGGIEYTADIILGLQYLNIQDIANEKNKTKQRDLLKNESLKNPREIELVCLKQRNGKQTFSCGYDFYPMFNYFSELN